MNRDVWKRTNVCGGGKASGEEGGNVTPFSQFSHLKPQFLEGNVNYTSIPQMATFSTSRVLRYVF